MLPITQQQNISPLSCRALGWVSLHQFPRCANPPSLPQVYLHQHEVNGEEEPGRPDTFLPAQNHHETNNFLIENSEDGSKYPPSMESEHHLKNGLQRIPKYEELQTPGQMSSDIPFGELQYHMESPSRVQSANKWKPEYEPASSALHRNLQKLACILLFLMVQLI